MCLLTFNSFKLVAQDFITVWDLSKPGSGSNQIKFNFEGTGFINYSWEEIPSGASGFGTMIGSGSTYYDTCIISGLPYATKIRLKIQPTNFNHFIASFDNKKLINVEQWGSVFWKSMRETFSGCSNMIISATDTPDLSSVFDMSFMFYNAVIFNQPIDSWNVTNVSNMSYMFKNASSFNQPLGNWNTGNVTSMASMFLQAYSFNQDINNWNTSKVTDMSSMFDQAFTFNQPIGNWDVSKVTDMSRMFFQAYVFNKPIGNWNTAYVMNMSRMFFNADSFNQPIGNWNVYQVTNMSYMFYNATSFNQPIGNWNVYQVANLSYMFYNASSFNQPIGNWNTFQATDISYMFYNASSFNQPIENWNTSNVSQMHSTFKKAISFNQPLNNWIVSNVQYMTSMFDSTVLFNQPLNLWDVQSVSNMSNIFRNSGFNQSLGDWNISNVTFIDLSSKMDCEKYSITLAKWYASGFTYKRLTSPSLKYGQDVSFLRGEMIYIRNWTITGDSLVGNNCLPDLVSGILYFDGNGNGNYDSLDYLIPNQMVSATNGTNTYYGLTDSVGRYHISISDYSGVYTISINNNNSQFSITEPLAQTYYLNTDSSYINKNFGLYSTNQFSDIQSDIWAGPARFGFSNNYVVVQVCNQGTQSLTDSVSMILPTGFIGISSSQVYSQNGQMLHWNYSLNPFECKTFEFIYQVPTTIPVGSEHTFYVLTNPNSDCCSTNNIDSTKVTVTAAYDPNDKQTDQGNTLSFLTNNYLDYTIRFQNVGTDTAFNVVVDDQLNYQFDIQSFRLLASSHPCKTEFSNGQIKWNFQNIQLPPAAINDPESNGYIRFRIKLLDGLTPPIWVDNTAFIYFDFNPAIVTNTVVNQFIIVNKETHQNEYIHLYPNPFDHKIFIDLKQHSNADLIFYNSNGQEVLSKQIEKSGFCSIDLPIGQYFYKIVINGQIQHGKIIKSN